MDTMRYVPLLDSEMIPRTLVLPKMGPRSVAVRYMERGVAEKGLLSNMRHRSGERNRREKGAVEKGGRTDLRHRHRLPILSSTQWLPLPSRREVEDKDKRRVVPQTRDRRDGRDGSLAGA